MEYHFETFNDLIEFVESKATRLDNRIVKENSKAKREILRAEASAYRNAAHILSHAVIGKK